MFEIIDSLRKLERQRKTIQSINEKIGRPFLSDTVYISDIYEITRRHKEMTEYDSRLLFLLVVVIFYSPKKLTLGQKIKRHVMAEVCRVTKCSQTLISHNARNMLFYCRNYRAFREKTKQSVQEFANFLVGEGYEAKKVYDYIFQFL